SVATGLLAYSSQPPQLIESTAAPFERDVRGCRSVILCILLLLFQRFPRRRAESPRHLYGLMRFHLVDRILDVEPGRRLRAVKFLTLAEEYLADHFPTFPVMPGVLQLQALIEA